jgi:hypothetical protein
MVAKKPVGDGARKGAVRRGSQIKIKLIGRDAWTKRNKRGGKFTAVKKSKKKFKATRREKKAA